MDSGNYILQCPGGLNWLIESPKLQEKNGYEYNKLMNVPFQVVLCMFVRFLDQQDLSITNKLLRPGNQNIFSKDWNNLPLAS